MPWPRWKWNKNWFVLGYGYLISYILSFKLYCLFHLRIFWVLILMHLHCCLRHHGISVSTVVATQCPEGFPVSFFYRFACYLDGCWTKNRGILPPKMDGLKIMVPTLWTNGWFGGKHPLFLVQHPDHLLNPQLSWQQLRQGGWFSGHLG